MPVSVSEIERLGGLGDRSRVKTQFLQFFHEDICLIACIQRGQRFLDQLLTFCILEFLSQFQRSGKYKLLKKFNS